MTLGSYTSYIPTGSVLFNSAQLVRKYFKYLGFGNSRMVPEETSRESRHQNSRRGSIIGMNASRLKRGGERREGTEPMHPPNKTRDLARSLIAREADASTTSLQTKPATLRVYERLRQQLGAPVGVDGFQSLASRALVLAKSQSPRLSAVEFTANGDLRGLGEVEFQTGADEDGEAGITLIAQLLGLFLTFLGEATTLRLIEDLRLQAEVSPVSATTTEGSITSAADGPVMAAVFEDLLREIDRLRNVSEHIEILAGRHPGMEDGLVSVAGNIRSIATVLDVFTLIRSRAGGPQDELPDLQTNRYMN
jgi:hypothetical protein